MEFKIFRKLSVGGLSRGELLEKLVSSNIHHNEYANTLFENLEFSPPMEIFEFELVKVNSEQLGFTEESPFNAIVEKASRSGLKLCPLYLAAFLRLEYLEQEEGPYLHVASKKTKDDPSYPNGLYLRNHENKLWLRGYRADDDFKNPLDWEFVFTL